MTLRSVDLNLFRVFEAIMQHRSVSGAAGELGLTPSAVSHALARLRKTLGDELFVTGPGGMEPTPRAADLAPDIRNGMQRLLDAVAARPFIPRDAVRSFGIIASDYPSCTIVPPLVAALAAKAPNVTLRVFPGNRTDAVRFLDEGRVDLLLTWVDDIPERMCSRVVMNDEESIVVRTDHPLTRGVLTRERLFEFPHVVVELTGSEDRGMDGFIDERGVVRRTWSERLLIETGPESGLVGRIAITVPNYAPVAPILEQTNLIASLPRSLALQMSRQNSLVMLELPYEPLRFPMAAVWHQRSARDRGLLWLIDELVEANAASL
ncbi:LysR family transcriptional regulator [Lichenicola sp.]|uniref:LysR family transcriptional regulator n=1 Tax=Lichenicola sp. TaxID=2804529 RepID=UPI003B00D0F5